ncbi:MAG: hypothetical protein RMH74_05245 [Candidatus Caldarchaeum sp.]|nr:hypothetical protein [Candidatus Caldarchaeum sp.]
MYSLIIMLAGLAVSMAGFYIAGGRRVFRFGGESFATVLPIFFLSTQTASYLSSAGVFTAAAVMMAAAAGLLLPLAMRAEQLNTPKTSGFSVVQRMSLVMLFAAVFYSLVSTAVSPVIVVSFAAAGFCYVAAVGRMGRATATAASSAVVLAGLYAYFTVPSTLFTQDIILIAVILVVYAIATLSPQTLEKFMEAFTPAHLSLLAIAALAVLFSPLHTVQPPRPEFPPLEALVMLPAVFIAFSTAGTHASARPVEALLLVLAVSVVSAGGSFPQAVATLLLPVVGEPALAMFSATVQAVLQFVGLSAMTLVLYKLSKASQASELSKPVVVYGLPAIAVGLGAAAVFGSSAGDLLFLAGAVNMMSFAVLLADVGGVNILAASALFLISFNSVVLVASRLNVNLPAEAMPGLEAIPAFIPPAFSIAIVLTGTWSFSLAVAGWLIRRRLGKPNP